MTAKRKAPGKQTNCGFTLVELIIVIVLLGMLAAVGSSMLSDSFKTTLIVNAGNASEGQARYVLERIAREIREVKSCHGSACLTGSAATFDGYCITAMTASQLAFYKRDASSASAADTSACATGSVNRIINYDGSSTVRLQSALTSSGSDPVLTSSVAPSGFSLSYLQADGSTLDLGAPSATLATYNTLVQFVRITLTVKDTVSGQAISQRLTVGLRNS